MLSLELGRTYRFTLLLGRAVDVVIIGSQPNSPGGTLFTISVGGVQGAFSSINDALGEPFTNLTVV